MSNLTMIDKNSEKWLIRHLGANVRFDEPMSLHTSLKVGGITDAYIIPQNPDQLKMLICYCGKHEIEYIIVGDGTNLLVKDSGIRGVVIVLTHCLNKIVSDGIRVRAMAGARTATLCRFAIRQGLEGMNFALGIPGTIGGAIRMNAGTGTGAMGDRLESLTVLLSSGERRVLKRQELDMSYRKLSWSEGGEFGKEVLISEACFVLEPSDSAKLEEESREILRHRHEHQPTKLPSAGCFFKNPPGRSAGQLIDMAGFKGKSVGGAQVSEKHANFIVNRGGASASDILALAEMIREKVCRMFGIVLEPEVRIVG